MASIICSLGKKDITPVVRDRMLNCADGEVISFEPGAYHFWPEHAFEKYYYISNNRHGLKCIAFPIIGKRNVTVDGNGATFVFHGEMVPFVVEESESITLKDFSVDWIRPFYSQGKVVGIEPNGVTIRIDRNRYPYRVQNDRMVFEGEGWESPLIDGILEMDAETGSPAYGSGDSLGAGWPEHFPVEEVVPGVIRLTDAYPHCPKVGNDLVLRHYSRNCPAVFLKASRDILLNEVTICHAGGMGVIGQFCENVTLRKCVVTPAPGRVFSTAADASHFVNCRGDLLLEDCLFEGQLDDPCNVHGIYTRIKEVCDGRSLVTELVHHEQHGVDIGFPGDCMGLSDHETLLSYSNNVVESVERIDERFYRITFRNPFPNTVRAGNVLENLSWFPNVVIQGCVARHNRARGFLVSTPGIVVIKNNRIESSGAGIKISGDANHWFESGAVRDVLICNNEFRDCCFGSSEWGRAVIDIDPEISNPWNNPECFHRNIRIEHNRFYTFHTGILFARSVDGIKFKNNTVHRTDTYAPIGGAIAALTFEACRNIDPAHNSMDDSLKDAWVHETTAKHKASL